MLDAVTPMLSVIVTVYGLVSGASSLLQARRLVRRGTSSDVSLAFLGLYVAGYGLWLLYGLTIGSLPLILVDAVGLLCGAATLALAVRLPRPRAAQARFCARARRRRPSPATCATVDGTQRKTAQHVRQSVPADECATGPPSRLAAPVAGDRARRVTGRGPAPAWATQLQEPRPGRAWTTTQWLHARTPRLTSPDLEAAALGPVSRRAAIERHRGGEERTGKGEGRVCESSGRHDVVIDSQRPEEES